MCDLPIIDIHGSTPGGTVCFGIACLFLLHAAPIVFRQKGATLVPTCATVADLKRMTA
jgi:hypothetical protein